MGTIAHVDEYKHLEVKVGVNRTQRLQQTPTISALNGVLRGKYVTIEHNNLGIKIKGKIVGSGDELLEAFGKDIYERKK